MSSIIFSYFLLVRSICPGLKLRTGENGVNVLVEAESILTEMDRMWNFLKLISEAYE